MPVRRWVGNFAVQYWGPEWQHILFGTPESYLERILARGFDGVYLDRVDAFFDWKKVNRSARADMAQLIARLEHLHIVPLHDCWREPDGAYLIMRWIQGGSLRSRLAKEALSANEAAWVTAGPYPELPKEELTRAMEYLKQHWQRRYGLVEVG